MLRATVVAGTMAIAATAWIGRDLSDLAAQPVVFGLAYLAFALAVAIRFGAIPLHTWAARLTDTVPESTLPLVTAWAPAAFAIVALAWADASIAPLLVDLDAVRVVVLAIAVTSIVLASVAAFIQDDLEHIVGYAIIGDAGVVLLAIAALDPAAWAPARTWILAFVVARSAFAAWAAATRTVFSSGRVADLRGWAIRSPALGVVLVVIVIASLGVPGLAAFDARAEIVGLAVEGPLGALVLLGALSPLVYYGRLLLVGVGRPDGRRAGGALRPVVSPMDLTNLRRWLSRTWSDNLAVTAAGGGSLAGDPGARGVVRGVRCLGCRGRPAADARCEPGVIRPEDPSATARVGCAVRTARRRRGELCATGSADGHSSGARTQRSMSRS